MKNEYDVEAWAEATTRGRRLFIYNFELHGSEFEGWNLLKMHVMSEGPDRIEKVSLWQPAGKKKTDLVRIGIAELPDWRLAQIRLHDELAHSMRPAIPRGTGVLAQVGDVNFVGRESVSDVAAAVDFTRGNLCVSVRSAGDRTVNVSEIACSLDQRLNAKPSPDDLRKGRVLLREPKAAISEPGEAVVLIPNLHRVKSGKGWLKVVAPDGELSRRDDALMYASSQGGRKRIETYLVRENIK